jgi:hypothetical protein
MSENNASRFLIDNSRVMLQTVASLTGNSRGVIHDRYMFIVQAREKRVTCMSSLGVVTKFSSFQKPSVASHGACSINF